MLIIGDFNVGIDEPQMKSFCKTYNRTNLIKQPACYKSPDNSTCRSSRPEVFCEKGVFKNFAKLTGKNLWQSLDLILTNDQRTFQSTCVIKTGLLKSFKWH